MGKCIICGTELVDGKCPNEHGLKNMCLNCKWCICEGEHQTCSNPKVLEIAENKMKAAMPEGYEIETLKLKPMKLKDPTKKCKEYEMDTELVRNHILESYGLLKIN